MNYHPNPQSLSSISILPQFQVFILMQRYRFCWFLVVILFSLSSVCAVEKERERAPIDIIHFSDVEQSTTWIKTNDFISSRAFSTISPLSKTDVSKHYFNLSEANEIISSIDEESADVIIRGQSPLSANGFTGRVRFDFLSDFDRVTRIGGEAFVNVRGNFGIETGAYEWERKLIPGGTEKIQTGDLNLIYSLTQNSRIRIRSGAGAFSIKRGNGTSQQYGYNFTTSIDVNLLYNLYVAGEMDWGKIEDKKMIHYRGSLGYYIRPIGIFIGYDSYKFDGLENLSGYIIGGDLRF